MNWRRPLALLIVSGTSIAAGLLGVNAIATNVEFARAKQAVAEAREELASVPDDSGMFRRVAKAIEPSVVKIVVRKTVTLSRSELPFNDSALRKFFDDVKRGDGSGEGPAASKNDDDSITLEQTGTGSGVIMDAANGVGFILSNNHVVGDADRVDVTLADGRVIEDAKVVGTDAKSDLAVVQIKAERLIPAEWGDSGKLEVGDRIMAFGSPFGYVGSMTHGIVSALHRQAGVLGEYGYEDFIQVDAPINPGNSGGPLVNIRGRVVGINAAIASESGGFQGIGFAIPSNVARQVYTILKEKGKVTRGWLGIQSEDVAKVSAEAKAAGYEGRNGVLVKGVLRDTPAAGKLRPGDVITVMDGQPTNNVQQLREKIAVTPPGSETNVRIVREGKEQTIKIKLGEQPGAIVKAVTKRPAATEPGTAGMRLMEVPKDVLTQYRLGERSGALVTTVKPGSTAAQAGIRRGDVITRIDQQDVRNAKEANDALAKADLKKGVRIFTTNRHGAHTLFLQSQR